MAKASNTDLADINEILGSVVAPQHRPHPALVGQQPFLGVVGVAEREVEVAVMVEIHSRRAPRHHRALGLAQRRPQPGPQARVLARRVGLAEQEEIAVHILELVVLRVDRRGDAAGRRAARRTLDAGPANARRGVHVPVDQAGHDVAPAMIMHHARRRRRAPPDRRDHLASHGHPAVADDLA